MLYTCYNTLEESGFYKQSAFKLVEGFKDNSDDLKGNERTDYINIKLALFATLHCDNFSDFKQSYKTLREFVSRNRKMYLTIIKDFKGCINKWDFLTPLASMCYYIILAAAMEYNNKILIDNKVIYSKFIDTLHEINEDQDSQACTKTLGLSPITASKIDTIRNIDSSFAEKLDSISLINTMSFYAQLLLDGFITESPVTCEAYLHEIATLNQSSGAICYRDLQKSYKKAYKKATKDNTSIEQFISDVLSDKGIASLIPRTYAETTTIREVNQIMGSKYLFLLQRFDKSMIEHMQGCFEYETYDGNLQIIYSFVPILDNKDRFTKIAFTVTTSGITLYGIEDISLGTSQLRVFFFDNVIGNKGNEYSKVDISELAYVMRHAVLEHIDTNINVVGL